MTELRPLSRADVVFRRVGGDWLLFDPVAQRVHVLNLTAALVWSFCTGKHTIEEIEARVTEAFPDGVRGQPAAEALEAFRAAGLLREAGPPQAEDDGATG